MPKRKNQGPCAVIGCGKPIETREWCEGHYYRLWKFGRLDKVNIGNKRNHPLYIRWHERKRDCVQEWKDFWQFVEAVKKCPGDNYTLEKITLLEPWGPNNFQWLENLVRHPKETDKAWYARKWADRKEKFPQFDRARHLVRNFNITPEIYQEISEAQAHVCDICKNPETAIQKSTGRTKRLAVDHCHASGKNRALLCWRCNSTLGKVKDNPELLEAMASYLRRFA